MTPDAPVVSFNEKVVDKEDVVEVYIIFVPTQEPVTLESITVVGCEKESTTTTATTTSTGPESPCAYGNTTRIGQTNVKVDFKEDQAGLTQLYFDKVCSDVILTLLADVMVK